MAIGKKHLCDECGKEYFSSCHECIHTGALLVTSINELLGKLPVSELFQDVRRRLSNMKEFNERRFIDLNKGRKHV